MYWLLALGLVVLCLLLMRERLMLALIRHWAEPGPVTLDADIDAQRDIPYVVTESGPLLLDLYRPRNSDSPLPVVLVLFGGGWFTGNKNQPVSKPMQVQRLTRRGYAVAVINYRLSSQAKYPAPVQDARAAVRWLRECADEYGLDASRIASWGFSAGGHLSAMLATTAGQSMPHEAASDTDCSVDAAISFFGPSDLISWAQDSKRTGIASPRWMLQNLLEDGLAIDSQETKRASPVHWVTPKSAPMLLLHGENDKVVPTTQSEIMYAALRRNKVDASLCIVPGAGHGSGKYFTSEEMIDEVVNFLSTHLGK